MTFRKTKKKIFKDCHTRTILVKFGSNWISFLRVVKESVKIPKVPIFNMSGYVGHLGWCTGKLDKNFREDHPRTIPPKFG